MGAAQFPHLTQLLKTPPPSRESESQDLPSGERLKRNLIPFIENKVINYRDLFGIFRLSFLVNIQNIKFKKMLKISQRFHANLCLYF